MFRLMTQSNKDVRNDRGIELPYDREPCIIVNFSLAAIIILVFVYAAVFSPDRNDYPVVCIHEKLTGEQCASCGLSHSFSLIVRGRISEALDWNPYGLRVFLFFALQLVMRVACLASYSRNPGIGKKLIILDVSTSSLLFLVTFMPFLKSFLFFL